MRTDLAAAGAAPGLAAAPRPRRRRRQLRPDADGDALGVELDAAGARAGVACGPSSDRRRTARSARAGPRPRARGGAGLVVVGARRSPRSARRARRPRRRRPSGAPGRAAPVSARRGPRPRPRSRVTPPAPLASTKRVSDVDSLPSTVMRLSDAAAAPRSSSASTAGSTIGVGRGRRDHRPEVGADHRRALGHRADAHLAAAQRERRRARLGPRVGGADGLRRGRAAVGRELAGGRGDAGLDALHGQRHADHAGRADEHLARRGAERAAPSRRPSRARPASPRAPVQALALPELTTIARARPSARCSRESTTGAAARRLRVNAPAALAAPSHATRATSGAPEALIPQAPRRRGSRAGS